VFFFLVASVTVSYNASALENDRKKWLPDRIGRSQSLPSLQRREFFFFCFKVAATLPCPWTWSTGETIGSDEFGGSYYTCF
jgi:hypothetical protein